MKLLMGLTSPCRRCTAKSGQHGNSDECLIFRNTSQIKAVPALNSKAYLALLFLKTIVDNRAALSPILRL